MKIAVPKTVTIMIVAIMMMRRNSNPILMRMRAAK